MIILGESTKEAEMTKEIENATLTVHPYPRTCILCKHFHIYTPDESFCEDNEPAAFHCEKGYWYISSWEDSIGLDFQLTVMQAGNCIHFENDEVLSKEYNDKLQAKIDSFRTIVEKRHEGNSK